MKCKTRRESVTGPTGKSHDRAYESDARLRELGLTESILRQSVTRGVIERFNCSPHAPACYPGLTQWAYTYVGLMEDLGKRGWSIDNPHNLHTVVSPKGIAVAVASGNGRTGRPGLPAPMTRYPKGAWIEELIVENNQLSLLPTLETSPTQPFETWYLLVFVAGRAVRFELSYPAGMGNDNRINSWSERIIPEDPISFDTVIPRDDEPTPPDIDVPVERI